MLNKMVNRIFLRQVLLGSSLVILTQAAQPSAPRPVAAPMRDLPWGELNFLATTDTHGWHAGHLQEAQYSGDWGDYISFAYHMRQKADDLGVDLLLVDTGDRVDGNGLYDGSKPKGVYTYDIFKEQHIDIICTGNHELYEREAADREYTETVPNFRSSYLASNLDIINKKTGERVPLAPRYRKFTTKNRGVRVLAFGFLFDFTGNANNTFVQPVEETIKEKWFQEAIREDVDIFVVAGHVDLESPEYKALFRAIRDHNWDTPIQFFGGHSHIRNFVKYDSLSYALESGRYMETVGWMAIDGVPGGGTSKDPKWKSPERLDTREKISFRRMYIDNNLYGYHHHTGFNDSTFPTDHGRNVSKQIQKARKALDLDQTFGCAPQDYLLNRAELASKDSMFPWLTKEVFPDILIGENRSDNPRMGIINTGAMRFDIWAGQFTKDTVYIVSPFTNRFRYIKDVPYAEAKSVLALINNGGPLFESGGLQSWALVPPEQMSLKENFIVETHKGSYTADVQVPFGFHKHGPNLVPGYTTKDAAGDDGDDTLHSPISFYRVPNCVHSEISFPENGEPDQVDLIFLDFVQPWVLMALRFLGQKYSEADTTAYIADKTYTQLLEEWIRKNWSIHC